MIAEMIACRPVLARVLKILFRRAHKANFTCTIETQLTSFYFKLFHRAICTNQFLHKIGRADNPNCYFCSSLPESRLFFTFFANVKKFLPSEMSYVS